MERKMTNFPAALTLTTKSYSSKMRGRGGGVGGGGGGCMVLNSAPQEGLMDRSFLQIVILYSSILY